MIWSGYSVKLLASMAKQCLFNTHKVSLSLILDRKTHEKIYYPDIAGAVNHDLCCT